MFGGLGKCLSKQPYKYDFPSEMPFQSTEKLEPQGSIYKGIRYGQRPQKSIRSVRGVGVCRTRTQGSMYAKVCFESKG